MKSPLSVDQWQLFLQIAERGSLTETAAARDVAQSAISRQLGAIERACGGKLFERTPRGVRLNEVGQSLYPRVQAWVQQGQALTEDATGQLREPAGLVRLGIIESLADEVCAPVLAETRKKFPEIRLHLVPGMSGRISESLERGALDIALFSENTRGRSGRGDAVGRMPHVLVGPPGDRLTAKKELPFEALHDLPLVVPGQPYAFHSVLEHWARRSGIRLNVQLECDALHLQKRLVVAGGLYAIMGLTAVRSEVATGQLQAARIVRPSLDRNIVLRVSTQTVPSQATLAVRDIVRRQVRKVFPSHA
ncbi:MAG: LysR family transcriptional regulator [Ramlibacter sp.]|uniref:LysR family transcriptional regulator n=1 Tax=Ramlibacter sp. TaxID=1917967 RepID=UPI002610F4BA|nr:LysR family transcriptional regulator [Ramlibacter sp.]MDH4377583.1 LysR family transcriptional regulator [Ramlibacter sp.]